MKILRSILSYLRRVRENFRRVPFPDPPWTLEQVDGEAWHPKTKDQER